MEVVSAGLQSGLFSVVVTQTAPHLHTLHMSNEHFLAAGQGSTLRTCDSLLCDAQTVVAGRLVTGSAGVKWIAQGTANLTETPAFEQLIVDK